MAHNIACPECGTRNKHLSLYECVESLKIEVRSLRRHYQEVAAVEKKARANGFAAGVEAAVGRFYEGAAESHVAASVQSFLAALAPANYAGVVSNAPCPECGACHGTGILKGAE